MEEERIDGNNIEEVVSEVHVEENKEVVGSTQVVQEKEPQKKKKIGWVVLVLLLVLGVFVFLGYNRFLKQEPVNEETVENEKKEYKSEYRLSGNGLEDFDLYFMKLENNNKNTVYSPLSIKYALAMLREGSNGDSKTQIDAIIGDYVAKSYPNNEHMSFANAMFIRDTYKNSIKESYTNNLKTKFNAEVITDSFASPDTINTWVSNRTFHLVNNILDDVSENDFFLINALAIDMDWNNQVHCALGHKIPCTSKQNYSTHVYYSHEILDDDAERAYSSGTTPYESEEDFFGNQYDKHIFDGKEYTKGGTIVADFNKYDIISDLGEDKIREIIAPEYEEWLKSDYGKDDLPLEQGLDRFINELKENYGKQATSTDFFVHEDDDVRVFAKDLQEYDGSTLQYVGIMPKTSNLADFIKNTSGEQINGIIKNLKEVKIESFEEGYVTRIKGFIPFFQFEYELQLMEDLKKLGIKDVFDENADLSNMIEESAYINKAVHKANIEFSNDGIRAAAATADGGAGATRGPFFEHLFKVPVKDIDVTFDKPFIYIIRDKATGEVWFAGTVYEPIFK